MKFGCRYRSGLVKNFSATSIHMCRIGIDLQTTHCFKFQHCPYAIPFSWTVSRWKSQLFFAPITVERIGRIATLSNCAHLDRKIYQYLLLLEQVVTIIAKMKWRNQKRDIRLSWVAVAGPKSFCTQTARSNSLLWTAPLRCLHVHRRCQSGKMHFSLALLLANWDPQWWIKGERSASISARPIIFMRSLLCLLSCIYCKVFISLVVHFSRVRRTDKEELSNFWS